MLLVPTLATGRFYVVQGLKRGAFVDSKSTVFRVASVKPWARTVAAIKLSIAGNRRPAFPLATWSCAFVEDQRATPQLSHRDGADEKRLFDLRCEPVKHDGAGALSHRRTHHIGIEQKIHSENLRGSSLLRVRSS